MPKKRGHGDGGLYFIKSRKLWRGVYDLEPDPVTGNRRQKVVHSKSQAECRRKLNELIAEIEEFGAPVDKSVTVDVWARSWLTDYKKPTVDPHTYSVYLSAVNVWISPTIGHIKVGAMKPSDAVKVMTAMRKKGRAVGSTRIVYQVMTMMFEQARREGLCKKNVLLDVDPPAKPPKGARGKRQSIPLPQAAHLLEVAAHDEFASYWWFKLLGGPRQTETLGATLDSLDLKGGIYYVNWSLELVPYDHGCTPRGGDWSCGKKRGASCPDRQWRIPQDFEFTPIHGQWCLTRPKSVIGRAVPLIPQLRAMIGEYLARHADEPNPHGLIWRHPDGRPIIPKDEAQMWRDLLHKAGLLTADELAPGKASITGHWARHTTVTLLASLNVDAQLIGEIVGHSSREVTEIYRHADHTEKAAAMEKLGQLVLPGGVPAIEA